MAKRRSIDECLAELRALPDFPQLVKLYVVAREPGGASVLIPRATELGFPIVSENPATIERFMAEMLAVGNVNVLTYDEPSNEPTKRTTH